VESCQRALEEQESRLHCNLSATYSTGTAGSQCLAACRASEGYASFLASGELHELPGSSRSPPVVLTYCAVVYIVSCCALRPLNNYDIGGCSRMDLIVAYQSSVDLGQILPSSDLLHLPQRDFGTPPLAAGGGSPLFQSYLRRYM
jgi:hypothetical protein